MLSTLKWKGDRVMRRTMTSRSGRMLLTWLLIAALVGVTVGCAPTGPRRQAQRDQRAERLVNEAGVFLDRGLTDSALAAFGLALEENPDLTEAHVGMGNIFRQRGDLALASNAFQRAVETDPNSFEAQYNLGLVRQLMGDLDLAVRTYLRALTINPDSFDANRDLASAYLQLGRAGAAIGYAQRATQLNPDSQAAWCNLAAAYSLTNRYDEAVDAYRQGAELGELAEPVLLGLADAHIQLGNYQRAINVLDRLIERDGSATAHERMGLALFKQRNFDEALASYRNALEVDAESTAALNGVGVCLMTEYLQSENGDKSVRDEAVAAWRKSVRLRPNQSRIIDLLARYAR